MYGLSKKSGRCQFKVLDRKKNVYLVTNTSKYIDYLIFVPILSCQMIIL